MKDLYGNQVDLIITSPPYFNQKECAKTGTSSDGNFSSIEKYFEFMTGVYEELKRLGRPGCIYAINVGSDTSYDLRSWTSLQLQKIGLQYIDTIAWIRGSGNVVRGFHINARNFYYPFLIWESVFIYRKNPSMGFSDEENFPRFEERFKEMISNTLRNNVWEIPQDKSVQHPAPFPVRLAFNLIACYSEPDSVILDPFGGSGSTYIAAQQIGNRRCISIELIKDRYDYSLQRISEANQGNLAL